MISTFTYFTFQPTLLFSWWYGCEYFKFRHNEQNFCLNIIKQDGCFNCMLVYYFAGCPFNANIANPIKLLWAHLQPKVKRNTHAFGSAACASIRPWEYYLWNSVFIRNNVELNLHKSPNLRICFTIYNHLVFHINIGLHLLILFLLYTAL